MLDAELGDFSPSFDQGTRNILLNLVAARTDRRPQGRFDPPGEIPCWLFKSRTIFGAMPAKVPRQPA